MTTSALVPAVWGKRAARRFCTCCEAELPEPNESWNRLPMDWATTVMTMMAPIQSEQDPAAVVVAPAGQPAQRGVLGLAGSPVARRRRPLGVDLYNSSLMSYSTVRRPQWKPLDQSACRPMMAGRGRRPGQRRHPGRDRRAARAAFAEDGYAEASMRGIARRAERGPGPRPPLLRRQGGAVRRDDGPAHRSEERSRTRWTPRDSAGSAWSSASSPSGSAAGTPGSPPFVSLAQAMAASPEVADNVRAVPRRADRTRTAHPATTRRRGCAGGPWCPRSSSASPGTATSCAWSRWRRPVRAEVARWAGPTIDRYATGELAD